MAWCASCFLVALGFLSVGEGGSFEWNQVQNTGAQCQFLVLKFMGLVTEPTSVLGLETEELKT